VRRRTQAIVVVAILAALAVAVVVLAQVNRSDANVETGTVAVTCDGATLKSFDIEQAKALRSVSEKMTILSSSHADETAVFTGVPLRVLLDAAQPGLLSDATMVVTRATDGYVSSLTPEEVRSGDAVLLAYAKDGESLGGLEDGGTGPFRIIILTDKYGNRCTKWVNEIEIR
jgi:DMSO/TMAO reductase YedYZ molybdopterin-dependent catalytic subunit